MLDISIIRFLTLITFMQMFHSQWLILLYIRMDMLLHLIQIQLWWSKMKRYVKPIIDEELIEIEDMILSSFDEDPINDKESGDMGD